MFKRKKKKKVIYLIKPNPILICSFQEMIEAQNESEPSKSTLIRCTLNQIPFKKPLNCP